MVLDYKKGFVSGPLLALLFISLTLSLSLGSALSSAVREAKENVQGIRAGLSFEENLIHLDQGGAFVPFADGPYRVRLSPAEDRIELWDGGELKEGVWLNGMDSY